MRKQLQESDYLNAGLAAQTLHRVRGRSRGREGCAHEAMITSKPGIKVSVRKGSKPNCKPTCMGLSHCGACGEKLSTWSTQKTGLSD